MLTDVDALEAFLEEAGEMAPGFYAIEIEDDDGASASVSANFSGDVYDFEENLEAIAEAEGLDPETTKINNLEWDREDVEVSSLNYATY